MRRKIVDRLIKWKDNKNRKTLILQRARQVGKTYSVLLSARPRIALKYVLFPILYFISVTSVSHNSYSSSYRRF